MCGVVLYDCANGSYVDAFVVISLMVNIVLVLLGVGPILGMGIGFKNKIVLHSFRKVKCP